MMKVYFVILILLFNARFIHSQVPSDEVVYAKIIDTLEKLINFPFYSEKLEHIDTQRLGENPTDTFSLIDPETYDQYEKTGLELKILYDSINLYEAKLYRQRLLFQDGLYMISKIGNENIHKEIKIDKYIQLDSYPSPKELKELSDSIYSSDKIGRFYTKQYSDANNKIYKYAIRAYISFSSIVWDSQKKYGIAECGFHYRYDAHGTSGGGFQAIIENIDNDLKIIKSIGLWEE